MSDPLFSVQDQVVVISGGSRGIGLALAKGFADRGARVVITGRDAASLEAAARQISLPDRPVVSKVCDVAEAEAGQRLVDEVVAEFGRLDTLVNCAGVNRRMKAENYTEADYDFITNINIRGAFFLSLAAGRQMIRQGRGSQINIDSINSHTPLKNVLVYAMSKAAMRQMTRGLAIEWGEHGVRVNAIGPGFTRTDLTRKLWETQPELNRWREANTPLRRIGVPEDLVGAAIFLASDASSYMTGQVLYIDGGTTSGIFWPLEV